MTVREEVMAEVRTKGLRIIPAEGAIEVRKTVREEVMTGVTGNPRLERAYRALPSTEL